MKRTSRIILGVLVSALIPIPMNAMADAPSPMVEFEKAVHFQNPKGEDVTVAPGIYRVEGIENAMRLTPEAGGNPLLLAAGLSQSTNIVEETVVEALPSDEEDYVLMLHHSNGQSWTAAGSFTGVRARGAAENVRHLRCYLSSPTCDTSYDSPEVCAAMHNSYYSKECVDYRAMFIAKQRKESLLKCIDSARNGPERKKVNLFGHEFNCKPANIIKRVVQDQLRGVTIKGRLSHHMGWYNMQTDEQVEYQVEKEYDAQARAWKVISKPVIKIKEAISFRPLVAEVLGYGLSSLGAPIPPVAIEFALDKMVENATGNWEKAAEKTVAAIALKVYSTPPGN